MRCTAVSMVWTPGGPSQPSRATTGGRDRAARTFGGTKGGATLRDRGPQRSPDGGQIAGRRVWRGLAPSLLLSARAAARGRGGRRRGRRAVVGIMGFRRVGERASARIRRDLRVPQPSQRGGMAPSSDSAGRPEPGVPQPSRRCGMGRATRMTPRPVTSRTPAGPALETHSPHNREWTEPRQTTAATAMPTSTSTRGLAPAGCPARPAGRYGQELGAVLRRLAPGQPTPKNETRQSWKRRAYREAGVTRPTRGRPRKTASEKSRTNALVRGHENGLRGGF